jgi:hypothetical protein
MIPVGNDQRVPFQKDGGLRQRYMFPGERDECRVGSNRVRGTVQARQAGLQVTLYLIAGPEGPGFDGTASG